MTETLDVIARRYSCRAFDGNTVPHEVVRAIAEAGLHAPSAFNRQPWRIIPIEDQAVVDAVAEAGLAWLKETNPAGYDRIMGRGGHLTYHAPAMIVLAEEPQVGAVSADLDLGILSSHVALAATSLGVDNCIAAFPAMLLSSPEGAELAAKIGIPDGFRASLTVLLGYAVAPGTPHEVDPAKILG